MPVRIIGAAVKANRHAYEEGWVTDCRPTSVVSVVGTIPLMCTAFGISRLAALKARAKTSISFFSGDQKCPSWNQTSSLNQMPSCSVWSSANV